MEYPNLSQSLKDRRAFLTAGAFTIVRPELIRGSGPEKLKAGLVGVGGRGRQAVADMLNADPNIELIAMGDVFEDKLESNLAWLKDQNRFPKTHDRVKVDAEHRFTGFDAYQKVIGSGVDVVMLCTPPGYRPMHFEAAVEAGKHVFCEKPFGTDPVGVRRFLAAAKKSEEKKLTVVSGAQRRFQREYVETVEKIQSGGIGEIRAAYAYWVGTPVIQMPKGREPKWGDMSWQQRNWYSYVWIGGDQIVEQHIHNIDVINWVMGTHPVRVVATGGAAWRPKDDVYGNIYDHIAADFEYPNGVRLSSYCRQFPKGLYTNVSELIIGAKGKSNCRDMGAKDINPYVAEHVALAKSIRGDGPYINHATAVAESTMTCIMARESAYSGEALSWEQIMNSQLDLSPKEFGYDVKMSVPPLPVPGQYKFL
ncbi:Gfo/Idh/MocA family protein [Bryobacter aggregatus]|uniref:Gfo/Idh/MocA family protein n=1 Tax=Bryobacter aggregatus TaxID=360054 RepID=UPI0004E0B0CB|nr:Gfo/Idh/MocA family oxidoreductase [Bryobacter aggregatus]